MKTVWQHTPDLEIRRILFSCHQLTNGFYSTNHFLPLPYPNTSHINSSVILPDIPYFQISRFWPRVARLDFSRPTHYAPKTLLLPLTTMYAKLALPPLDYSKLAHLWQIQSPPIINTLNTLFPQLVSHPTLTIHPTRFGTTLSFATNGKLMIWLREDQGIRTIVEGIISSLLKPHLLTADWHTTERVIDTLIKNSQLSQYFPSAQSTTPSPLTSKQQPALHQLSQQFLAKIGQLTPTSLHPHLAGLTPKEHTLYQSLRKISPQILTYDQIADLIFSSDADYSLGGITKAIHRLRNKLEQNSLPATLIQTHRGKGYSLYSAPTLTKPDDRVF